jgi:hypothetical protein
MAEQMGFDFGDGEMKKPTKAEEAKEKARARAAENAEYADKRVKSSPLIANAELEKMREILDKKPIKTSSQSSMLSPKGNITKAGSGGAYGGGDLEKGMQGGRMKKPSYCAGGSVKSASKRADGIAIRGKTRA